MLDYEPKTHASDAVTFFTLRVMQIYEYVRQKLSGIPVYFMGSDRMKGQCIKLMASRTAGEN